MITALDFIAVTLAAGAIIEVWHKGSIFDTPRAYAQALQDVTPPGTIKGKLLELIACPFCKSYHIPVYLFCLLFIANWFGGICAAVGNVVVYGLAATRASNIIDGLLPSRLQYTPDHGGTDAAGNAN